MIGFLGGFPLKFFHVLLRRSCFISSSSAASHSSLSGEALASACVWGTLIFFHSLQFWKGNLARKQKKCKWTKLQMLVRVVDSFGGSDVGEGSAWLGVAVVANVVEVRFRTPLLCQVSPPAPPVPKRFPLWSTGSRNHSRRTVSRSGLLLRGQHRLW